MPDVASVHIDRALSDLSIQYKNTGYVGETLSPVVSVAKESDRYFVYGKQNFVVPDAIRKPRAETREISFTLSQDYYHCEEYGFHTLIDDRERDNADEALDPDMDSTQYLTDMLQLHEELLVASKVFDPDDEDWDGYETTHFASLNQAWENIETAVPRLDIYYGRYIVFRDSRKEANHLFLPVEVSYRLSQMEQIDQLRKYTDPNLVTNSGLPSVLFGLKVVECQTSYINSAEGDSAEDMVETFGTNVVIAYIAPGRPTRKTLTFMLTFQRQPNQVRRWREEKKKSDAIEVSNLKDRKIVAPACGFVYSNTINTWQTAPSA